MKKMLFLGIPLLVSMYFLTSCSDNDDTSKSEIEAYYVATHTSATINPALFLGAWNEVESYPINEDGTLDREQSLTKGRWMGVSPLHWNMFNDQELMAYVWVDAYPALAKRIKTYTYDAASRQLTLDGHEIYTVTYLEGDYMSVRDNLMQKRQHVLKRVDKTTVDRWEETYKPWKEAFPIKEYFIDGGRVNSLFLKGSGIDASCYDLTLPEQPLLPFKDYSKIKFVLSIGGQSDVSYWEEAEVSKSTLIDLLTDYYKEKASDLVDAWEKYKDIDVTAPWRTFILAGINGEIQITCDKQLFGKAPGTNLSKHFGLQPTGPCQPADVEHPKMIYNYGETMPSVVGDYFQQGVLIGYVYQMYLLSSPSEKYDELTFTITMPLFLEHSKESSSNAPIIFRAIRLSSKR